MSKTLNTRSSIFFYTNTYLLTDIQRITLSYKGRSSGFLFGMEQNTSLDEYQKSLPILKAVQTLEHILYNLEDLDIVDPPAKT